MGIEACEPVKTTEGKSAVIDDDRTLQRDHFADPLQSLRAKVANWFVNHRPMIQVGCACELLHVTNDLLYVQYCFQWCSDELCRKLYVQSYLQ